LATSSRPKAKPFGVNAAALESELLARTAVGKLQEFAAKMTKKVTAAMQLNQARLIQMAKVLKDEKTVEKHGELGLATIGVKGMETAPIPVKISLFKSFEALLDAGVPTQKLARKKNSAASSKRAASSSRSRLT
jgi:hypothetical protein